MSLFDNITIIGLTGQSGAGKSTVSVMLRANDLAVIDADKISHAVAGHPEFVAEVGRAFPECVENGAVMRQKLAGIVFNNREKLNAYTDIIYPYITKSIFDEIYALKQSGESIIVLDAPTLFESGLDSICKSVISIVAPMEVKLARLLERDGIPVELISSRLSSQKSEEYFKERSEYVIENDSDLNALESKTEETVRHIRERFNV
jgi:dephospho-CoA kinase